MPIWIFEGTFLGLKGGFWLIGLPLTIAMIYLEVYTYKKQKKAEKDTADLPVENIIVNLSKEEKWMLENIIKRSKSENLDLYIKDIINRMK
ncbi:hypothetical protein [Clostridium butyricum]|jgi:hypothetical protein|uniref:Uncharacterized protein n=1 Tax=Clostridium butyricum TaxID=1492 RepID=A0A512TPV6_CLOBU|nr:hypothetical protein [Clostridium butyricum]MBZ5744548.1 hypothetical protein [Clostridium butyricum]MDI9209163.1 hypothetical protein [Clostridium butyricum]NOW21726.1 hypothetical protein [Clostridium butyricum]QMW90992.1 hypothetical protein FF104_08445 [Clostridium butyricum]BBK76852.1 hypothetical protein Cbu04g_18600 [Clostridium butyricum]